nr:uncharacterized protein LOC109158503 [Ipomoea trifida]
MLSEKNLKMLATQRFSDEQDLLDRSTKKPKGGGSSSAPMDLENNDVQDPVLSEGASDPDQVSLVEETPQTEMPMELANSMMHDAGTEDGGSESDHISQVAETPPMVTPVADPNVQTAEPVVGNLPPTNAPPGEQLQGDAPVPHQVDRVAQQPRSYLATVVGSGTAPRQDPDEVDNAGNENEQDRSDQQTAGAPSNMSNGGFTARPYGPWMIAQRRERRQNGIPAVQGRQGVTRGATRQPASSDGGLPAGGSRFAPLENDNGPDVVAEEDPRGAAGGRIAERADNQIPPQAENRGRSRRANVIVSEKQIANEKSNGGPAQSPATGSAPVRGPSSSRANRAAEEEEHVVIRGEQGGKVVSSTRVSAVRTPMEIPVESMSVIPEHHGDPPVQHDDEGDVEMEIEDQQETMMAEAGAGDRSPPGLPTTAFETWWRLLGKVIACSMKTLPL